MQIAKLERAIIRFGIRNDRKCVCVSIPTVYAPDVIYLGHFFFKFTVKEKLNSLISENLLCSVCIFLGFLVLILLFKDEVG